MGSTQDFVDYVTEQFEDDCGVTAKKIFGEFGLFSSVGSDPTRCHWVRDDLTP